MSKNGKDWDKKLGSVLFMYCTTPRLSSSEKPFYLVNKRDLILPSALSFKVPQVKYPVIETEFGKELFKDARELAKKTIQSAQQTQKKHCDRSVKDVEEIW